MGVGRFVYALANHVIFAGKDVLNDVFPGVIHYTVAHGNGVGDFEVSDLEFPFQAARNYLAGFAVFHLVPAAC